ncbi:MAG: VWA domain-containing protein, partial [Chloroflexi bacterium]|nr:VWA domain-containing protein [Chloroflexota bacterium]
GDEINASPPLNLSLVIDNSTSMAGQRMDMVKSSATELLRRLNPEDTLSIITFNDRSEVILPATPGEDFNTLASRISLLQTGGGTEMFHGLKAGFEEVNQNINPTSVNHIILITDGRTYGDEEQCLDLAEKASSARVTISALGIGSEWNDEFIDRLTAITGGNSVYADKPKDIRGFFKSQFDRLSSTYADKVSMQLTSGENVNLRYAFRLSPEPGPLATESEMNLGHIPKGSSLSVIMEFAVGTFSADIESFTLAEGTLNLDIPCRTIPSTTSRFSFIRPVGHDPSNQPPPQGLIKAMSRLSLYRLQEQARRELADGEVEKATTRLQNLATQLLMSGEPDLAQTVMLELKRIESGSIISDKAKKKIKYGTRALLLPAGD